MKRLALFGLVFMASSSAWSLFLVPAAGGQGPGWEIPVRIQDLTSGDAGGPVVAVDASGNAVAVWVQGDGTSIGLWANRYVVGSGWGSPELIEISSGTPEIALDPRGNATVVWQEYTSRRILAVRYLPGSGWTPAVRIDSGTGDGFDPDVGANPSGSVIAVWEEANGSVRHVMTAQYVSGVGWASPIAVDGSGQPATFRLDPRVGIDDGGNAIVVWSQSNGTEDSIWSARYTPALGWSSPVLVEGSVGNAWFPFLAVAPGGEAVVVWKQSDYTRFNAWTSRYVPGVGWDAPVLLETAPGDPVLPRVAIDRGGNATAVWTQSDGVRSNLWANRYVVGGGWGGAIPVESDDIGNATLPWVAADPGGNATVMWVQSDGTRDALWANRYTWGRGWGTGSAIATAANIIEPPRIASDATGNATAVWSQADGTYFQTWASRYNAYDDTPPAADAGPDQVVIVGDTVTLSAVNTTDNVGVANYTWSFDDGGLQTLWGGSPTYRFDAIGVFTIALTVRDAAGNADSDTVRVTVNPPPDTESPVANAGPDRSVVAGTTVQLNGSRSGDNVGIVEYRWTFNDEGPRSLLGMTPAYRFDRVGTFVVTLVVTDAAGNDDSDILVVKVTPPDAETPVANAGGDQRVPAGTVVSFDGLGSADNVAIDNYSWRFEYDGTQITLNGERPQFRFDTAGEYVVTLTVRDSAGLTASDQTEVFVGSQSSGDLLLILSVVLIAVAGFLVWILLRRHRR